MNFNFTLSDVPKNNNCDNETNIFARSENCRSVLPNIENIIVVGCGGIGSHLSYFSSMIGNHIKSLILIDDDVVEIGNVGRCACFTIMDVGEYKVNVLARKIKEKNINLHVIPVAKKLSECIGDILNCVSDDERTIVFDCRDKQYNDYSVFGERINIIRAAYDGYNITINLLPRDYYVWGPDRYQVSSHVLPSALVAIFAILCADKRKELYVFNSGCFTFDIFDIPSILFNTYKGGEYVK